MAQESQDIESIFDFFYLDTRKISSFYAQLTGSGAISTRKNISITLDETTNEYAGNLKVISGKHGSKNNSGQNSEDSFDASVTMPREMIDRLDELGYIYRDLTPENLGSIVLLNGFLSVNDIEVMKGLIKPSFDFMLQQMPNKTGADKTKIQQFKKLTEPLLGFISHLPFALSCSLYAKDEHTDNLTEVWMSLTREDISSQVHDISFKHGDTLAGQWYVLGVLDAIPNALDENKQNIPNVNDDGFGEFKKSISEVLKMFGRNSESYGMTPIAIFRVLKPN
ncbi:DUF6414 family protein [Acinetobacter pollinis]|uniref:DUF6414 family protein n=1 Tax=Acinetobacter pollinis TaxID=2605270 RepID=UPI0018C1DF95|nr:hypothetical protein [Acinetobacter pollinis]MBF7694178.1 hypothetical protein [Acinetobacter pollinis]MBF7701747.1 hypothetical protein [Acinetobacter pollinis]